MDANELMTKLGASKLPDDERQICKVIVDAYSEVTDEQSYLEVRRDISAALNRIGNPHMDPLWPRISHEQEMRRLFLLGNEVWVRCEEVVKRELRKQLKPD